MLALAMTNEDPAGNALRALQALQGGEIREGRLYPLKLEITPPRPALVGLDPNVGWFAVHTAPLSEFKVEQGLRDAGFQTFLPSFIRTFTHARKTCERRMPLFPRYCFVGFNPARQSWGPIGTVEGVTRLLQVAEQPLKIPDRLITTLMVDHLLKAHDEVRVFGKAEEPIRKHLAKKHKTWKGRKERARAREHRKRTKGMAEWLAKASSNNTIAR